jgi:hypothetical protein
MVLASGWAITCADVMRSPMVASADNDRVSRVRELPFALGSKPLLVGNSGLGVGMGKA